MTIVEAYRMAMLSYNNEPPVSAELFDSWDARRRFYLWDNSVAIAVTCGVSPLEFEQYAHEQYQERYAESNGVALIAYIFVVMTIAALIALELFR